MSRRWSAHAIAMSLLMFAVRLTAQTPTAPPRPLPIVPAPVAGATSVITERITVHGASLVGNLEGDSPDRDVFVYLPPSYATSPNRRFPVVYFFHG